MRREKPEWFDANANYAPLFADGPKKDHLIGYIRGENVITLAPRWSAKLGGSWAATVVEIPAGRWKNLLTGDVLQGGRLRVQSLLNRFPAALLARQPE